jgi:hypothetical protein
MERCGSVIGAGYRIQHLTHHHLPVNLSVGSFILTPLSDRGKPARAPTTPQNTTAAAME